MYGEKRNEARSVNPLCKQGAQAAEKVNGQMGHDWTMPAKAFDYSAVHASHQVGVRNSHIEVNFP